MRVANELDQLVGEPEFSAGRTAHGRGRQVAAQRDDALHAGVAVLLQQGGDVGAGRAHTGEVRCGLDAGLLHNLDQGVVRPVLIRASGAVGHTEKTGFDARQLIDQRRQFRPARRGPRREQLERKMRVA